MNNATGQCVTTVPMCQTVGEGEWGKLLEKKEMREKDVTGIEHRAHPTAIDFFSPACASYKQCAWWKPVNA